MVRAAGPLVTRERLWKAAFVVAFLASAYGLLAPATALPAPGPPWLDKAEHLVTFAALAALGRLAYPRHPAWGLFAALALWGLATELAQRDVPGRGFEWGDLLVDAIGSAAAFLVRPKR